MVIKLRHSSSNPFGTIGVMFHECVAQEKFSKARGQDPYYRARHGVWSNKVPQVGTSMPHQAFHLYPHLTNVSSRFFKLESTKGINHVVILSPSDNGHFFETPFQQFVTVFREPRWFDNPGRQHAAIDRKLPQFQFHAQSLA